MEAAGGKALAVVLDVRSEESIAKAVAAAAKHFGGIDVLVNNASAIQLTNTLNTPAKRFDLMHQVNVRATFLWYAIASPLHSTPFHSLTRTLLLNSLLI